MNIVDTKITQMHLLERATKAFESTGNENDNDNITATSKSLLGETWQTIDSQVCARKAYALHRSLTEPVLCQALDMFLANTVMPTSGGSAFNGHFSSLVSLVETSSKTEALPFALEAVALASLANRTCSTDLQLEAARRYLTSIRQLRRVNLNYKSNAFGVIACIVLLSIYEIIRADLSCNLNWLKHLHGLFAVMRNYVESHQLPTTAVTMLVLGSWPSSKPDEIIYSISTDLSSTLPRPEIPGFKELCLILPKVQGLFKKSAAMLEPNSIRYESALRQCRDEATSVRSEMLAWSSSQPNMTRAKSLQHFTQHYILRFPGTDDFVCPSYRADAYQDYSIACMWNSYCQCQLHLIDLLSRINRALSEDPKAYNQSKEYTKLRKDARALVDDICASIPFLLVGETIVGSRPDGHFWCQKRPPMLVGGLGLQWTIFTVSILEIVSMDLRQQMKTSLLWIGKNLGIGQATVLAHMDKNIPGGITARGDALRWTGFLI